MKVMLVSKKRLAVYLAVLLSAVGVLLYSSQNTSQVFNEDTASERLDFSGRSP